MNNKKISEKILIDDFGNEWNKFDQSKLNKLEHLKLYNNYFHLLPKNYFSKKIICADSSLCNLIESDLNLYFKPKVFIGNRTTSPKTDANWIRTTLDNNWTKNVTDV